MNDPPLPDPEAPPEIRALWPAYLQRRRDDLASMRGALQAGEFAEIRRRAHNVKGSGGSYGLHDMTRLGERLERAALRADAAEAGRLLDELETLVAKRAAEISATAPAPSR